MSKELFSSIDIAAPAEMVWEVLVDFARSRCGTRSSHKPRADWRSVVGSRSGCSPWADQP